MTQEQEPEQVASNEWGTLTYYPRWNTLELKWKASTGDMTDEGFKVTLGLLADESVRLRPAFVMVDALEFFHRPGEDTLAWRDEHVIPRYNEAGLQKFAFLAPAGMPGTVEKGGTPAPDGPANFPTAWFETRERMYDWLTS